ncbi:MAG: tetratricopeptide repeat protein [Gammaproteobacteria bacterium]
MSSNALSARVAALVDEGRLHEAQSLCLAQFRRHHDDPEAWAVLARVNERLGEMEEVERCWREVLRLRPADRDAHYSIGVVCFHQDRLDEARAAFEQVLASTPSYAPAQLNLALVHMRQGQLRLGELLLRRAIRENPVWPEAYSNLGSVLWQLGVFDEAERSYRRAIELRPEYTVAYNNLAAFVSSRGRLTEAAQLYGRALSIRDDLLDAHYNLGVVLLQMGRAPEAVTAFRNVLSRNPAFSMAHSSLLYALNNAPDCMADMLAAEHQAWAARHEPKSVALPNYQNLQDPGRRLRVGYISADFRMHSVAFFLIPFFAEHDPTLFDVICYANVVQPDVMSGQLRRLASGWREIYGRPDDEVVDLIRSDGVDILVDLSGHTAGNRLGVFARRAAPVQVTYLGYPNTTGLESMDYRLTDAWADPEGCTEGYHTETLVRIPGGFLCYQPPACAPEVAPIPEVGVGHVTFGSFNAVPKIGQCVVAAWATLLNAIPSATLLLKNRSFSSAVARARYRALFGQHGIDPERVELISAAPTLEGHLGIYGRVDVGLDTFPYNGTTTTCEALWMGVPVVTVEGEVHAGRVGCSILSQVGLEELIARDVEGYVAIAVGLARDRERRLMLREGLRGRMRNSSLMDGEGFARRLEGCYRWMWRKWCDEVVGSALGPGGSDV